MIEREVARRIRQVRETLGLSRPKIAEKVGCSFKSWQAYENGDSWPGGKILSGLKALGVSIDWLLTGEGSMGVGGANDELARIDRDLARLDDREGQIRKQHADEPDDVLFHQVEMPRRALNERRQEILSGQAEARQGPASIDLELLTTSIRDVESLVAALQDNATPAEKASLAAKWYRIQLKDRAEGKGAPAADLIDLFRKAS